MTKLLELVMIVKNSGEILRTCLRENKKYIDRWTILDTGSTDNTPDIIREELKDIPGTLHFGEFIDFSQARNKALDLSSKTCKFCIMLDDSYILHGGKLLRDILKKEKKSCVLIKIGKYIDDNYLIEDYFSKRITKSSDNLRYQFRVHEDIVVNDRKISMITDTKIFIDDLTHKEHKARSINRYSRDIQMLLLDHKDNPKEQRTIYYIAKTYYILEDYKKSLEYYSKLKELKSIREDFMFSAYYDSICVEYTMDNNINKFRNSLEITHSIFKKRVEPLYKLAVLYKAEGDMTKTGEILDTIINTPKPILLGTLIESDIYDYFIPYLYIDHNITVGLLNKAVPQLQKMLALYPTDQPLLNMKYSICDNMNISSEQLSEGKTIVIHTGYSEVVYCWNPKGDKRISGSEYMAMNLALEFYKLGYRVFIIGSFYDPTKDVNYEGIVNGIEYIDYRYFSEFALKYVIDYLIISRYATNLVYYDNIKNVYLWIHDVLPITNDSSRFIQYHKTKFKSIVGISEWQKENTSKTLNIPSEKIIVTRNAIYPERFTGKNVQKIPYRFIYSSCAERGLEHLIDMIPKIKEKYPQTELHLFVLRERVSEETLKAIERLDYVFLNDRISQEELAIEFLKTDVWLYPTTFPEAYCITALEAMASKCLVATVGYCALKNVVEGRGILCQHPIQENKENLLKKLFFVLENPQMKEHYIDTAYNWAMKQNYTDLAKEWVEKIF